MKKFLRNLRSKLLAPLVESHAQLSSDNEELVAMLFIAPLLQALPDSHGPSSLDFRTLRILKKLIDEGGIGSAVEFGSGYSTLFIAHCIRASGRGIKFSSIEHDITFISYLSRKIKADPGLYCDVSFHHCTLGSFGEYNMAETIQEGGSDLVIIDGPPANTLQNSQSRQRSIQAYSRYIRDETVIIVDDISRYTNLDIVRELCLLTRDPAVVRTGKACVILPRRLKVLI